MYDFLTPEAYLDTFRRAVAEAPVTGNKLWLDAGCGSGWLLFFIKERLNRGDRYVGTDLLPAGLLRARDKARSLGLENRVNFFQSDMMDLPVRNNCADVMFAHFSVYTIPEQEKRKRVLKNFRRALKSDGILVIVNPSTQYDPQSIIQASLELDQKKKGKMICLFKKWLVYPMTKLLGLRFIQHQIQTGAWHGFNLEELCNEVEDAGFEVSHSEPVYGNSAYLIVGRYRMISV